MKAIIPVAGEGTRLRPHTHTTPKALLEVAGKPIVGHILDELSSLGIEEVVMVIGYRGDMIKEYVESRSEFKSLFVKQSELLGLGHAIHLTKEIVKDGPGLIVLGDTIFESDLKSALETKEIMIGTKAVSNPSRFGIAEVQDGQIIRLVEKPDKPIGNLALVGIYVLPEMSTLYAALDSLVARNLRTKGEFQLTDALQMLLEQGVVMRPLEVEAWLDCGKPETLLATNRRLLSTYPQDHKKNGNVIIEPVYIAKSAKVDESVIGPYVSIGKNSYVKRSMMSNTIVNQNSEVQHASLEESIIGENAAVSGKMTRLNVGDSSEIDLGAG